MTFNFVPEFFVVVCIFVGHCAPLIAAKHVSTCRSKFIEWSSTAQVRGNFLTPMNFKCIGTPKAGPDWNPFFVFEECSFSAVPQKIIIERKPITYNKIARTQFTCSVIHLNLKGAKINTIWQGAFSTFLYIERLDLSQNWIENLPPNIFENGGGFLLDMKYLNLSFNHLRTLEPDSLLPLPSLRILDLSHNKIKVLHSESFKELPNLIFLDLSYNHINVYPTEMIRLAEHIRLYQMQDSNLKELEDDGSPNVTRIDKLELNSHHETNLEHLFSENKRLEILNISNNANIGKITPEMFGLLTNLKYLDLSFNKIKELIKQPFKNNTNLISIWLQGNHLFEIKSNDFKDMFFLEALDISHNANIRKLTPEIFGSLLNLKNLDLSFNKINDLEKGLFQNNSYLISIKLQRNRLSDIKSGDLGNMIFLEILNISYNYIEKINSEMFGPLKNLKHLDLSCNKIDELVKEAFQNNTNLVSILLQGNLLSEIKSDDFENMLFLETLNLSNNSIEKINYDAFGSLTNLKYLDLSFNKINKLFKEPFKNNSYLIAILLQGNRISEIKSRDFWNTLFLETLLINSNNIEKIAPDSFKNLTNLRHINLDSNFIVSLNTPSSSGAMFSNMSLKELILSRNRLKSISNIFENTSIHTLNLSGNIGLTLYNDTFNGILNLHSLYIEDCNVTYLLTDIFNSIPSLGELHMRNNSIQVIGWKTFWPLHAIFMIDLSYNKIEKFESNVFTANYHFYRPHLTFLNMSHNNVAEIESISFLGFQEEHCRGTVELDLSWNLLTEFNGFGDLILCLKSLNISYNNFTDISEYVWREIPYMESFVATNNSIQEVIWPTTAVYHLYNLNQNTTIYLENNNITRISILGAYKRRNFDKNRFVKEDLPFPSLQFYMTRNPIKCDCFAYEVNKYLTAYNSSQDYIQFVDDLICHTPLKLRDKKLKEVKQIDFECYYNDDPTKFECDPDCVCKLNCTCLYRPYDDFRIVNCSNREYKNLPVNIPLYTNSLDMSHNSLNTLVQLNETIWENLTEIRVENNSIVSSDFIIPPKVTYLDLRDNNLSKFPKSVESHAIQTKDFKVKLSGNLWPCDCSALNLKTFLWQQKIKVIDFDDVICILPNNSNTLLSKLDDNAMCPPNLRIMKETKVPIAVYAISILGMIISILLSVFCYKYKLYILSFVYTNCSCCVKLLCCSYNPTDSTKTYDGFLSHSSEDVEVAMTILEELEQKPPNYHLCVHQRNWMPGSYITDNIVRSVQNSRKTILVISKTFVKSPYFYLEFQAAFYQTLQDRKDRLILVLKGDMPDKSELKEDVRFVLATKTYLVWGERWFFQKLRYALKEENLPDSPKKSSRYMDSINHLLRRRRIPIDQETEL